MKIKAATFEVNMTNSSQGITKKKNNKNDKKQFQRQLTVPPRKKVSCPIPVTKKNISYCL